MSRTYKVRARSLDTAMRRAKVQFGPDAMILDTRRTTAKDLETMSVEAIVELTVSPGHPSNHGQPDARLERLSRVDEISLEDTGRVAKLQSEIERIDRLIRSVTTAEKKLRKLEGNFPLFESIVDAGAALGSARIVQESFEERVPPSEWDNRVEAVAHLNRYLRCVSVQSFGDVTGMHAFVGTAGGGKTSLLLKLATELARCERSVGVIVVSPYHAGDVRRIEAAASALAIDAAVVSDQTQFEQAVQMFMAKEVVLIDTPCWMSSRGSGSQLLKSVRSREDVYRHFVCDITRDMEFVKSELALAADWKCDYVATTKLDLVRKHGRILDIAVEGRLPFSFVNRDDEQSLRIASPNLLSQLVVSADQTLSIGDEGAVVLP